MKTTCPTCKKVFDDEFFTYYPCPSHPPVHGRFEFPIDANDRAERERIEKLPKPEMCNVHVDTIKTAEQMQKEVPSHLRNLIEEKIHRIMNEPCIYPMSRKHRRIEAEWLKDMAPGLPKYKILHAWWHLTKAIFWLCLGR